MSIRIKQRTLFGILYACLAASVLAGVLVHLSIPSHAAFLWQEIPVFSALYGFIGCVLIIVVSKALGHYWLQKEEDYYERQSVGIGEESK